MKKGTKIISAVLAGCIFIAGGFTSGYIIGKRAQSESEKSAMPKTVVEQHPTETSAPEMSPDTEISTEPEIKAPEEENIREIKKSEKSAVDSSWTEISKKVTVDNRTLSLYTDAQKDDMGFVWDDSQKWVVEISDGEGGYYTLYDQKITNGSVYYDVAEKESGEKIINVYTMTGAGTTIMQYSRTDYGYAEKEVYNSGTVNRIDTSIQNYR